MKNKLLLSSALISGLALSGAAMADATIKGSMTLSYKAASNVGQTAGADGYGRETQIDVRNSGELSNGMKYAAGFSLEQDGAENFFDGGEQVFIDVTVAEGTTISFGQDHMANLSGTAVPKVGKMFGTSATGVSGVLYKNEPGTGIYGDFGLGLIQKLGDAGTLTVNYVPNVDDTGGKDTTAGNGKSGKDGYDVTFNGSLGVEGLAVKAGLKKVKKEGADSATTSLTIDDSKATQIGAAYTFGNFTVGYNRNDDETGSVAGTANKKDEQTVDEFGIAVKVSDNLTLGASYAEVEVTVDGVRTSADEELMEISLGYNLGPVAAVIQYTDVENAGGVSGSDGETIALRLSTAF